MPIVLVAFFALVAIVGAVFEERARRSGAGWRSVARDFLAVIGAIALLVLAFTATGSSSRRVEACTDTPTPIESRWFY